MKNELPQAAIVLADREGTVLHKSGNPVHSVLEMELTLPEEGLYVKMHAMAAAQGNGSAGCEVIDLSSGEVLYEGGGSYFGLGEGCKPSIYVPGPWEQKLLARSEKYVRGIR